MVSCDQGRLVFLIDGNKVFIWRVMIGTLPLGDTVRKRNIARGTCFFCSVELEHSKHRCLSCPMVRMVWRYINLVMMSLTGVSLSSFSCVFAYMGNNELMSHFQIIF